MKLNLILPVILIVSVLLCGCGSDIPDLTTEQAALISEYATHLLVKHSELSDRDLLNDKELEVGVELEAEEKERKQKADAIAQTYLNAETDMVDESLLEDAGDEEDQSQVQPVQTIAEFFEEDSFSIDVSSYELCKSYPSTGEDEFYMAMDASSGKQLCVVKFLVQNLTGEDSEFDMLGKKGNYVLETDDGKSIPAQTTMLLDDLASYRGIIAGGNTEQMVLVFEVDDTITQMENAQLVLKNETGQNIIPLK